MALVAAWEGVDTDDRAWVLCKLLLIWEGRVGDLRRLVPRLDRRDHPAELLDTPKVAFCLALDLVGQRLDEIRPSERVCSVGDTGLESQHLLRPERDSRRFVRGQR